MNSVNIISSFLQWESVPQIAKQGRREAIAAFSSSPAGFAMLIREMFMWLVYWLVILIKKCQLMKCHFYIVGSLRRRCVHNSDCGQWMQHLHIVLLWQHGATEHALKLSGSRRALRVAAGPLLAGIGRLGQGHVPPPQNFKLVLPDTQGRLNLRPWELITIA